VGLQLPSELISLLGMLGYTWPEADETKLFELGQTWMGFGSSLQGVISDADAAAQQVWSRNKGDDIDAFKNVWSQEDSPVEILRDSTNGAMIIGACFFICAGIVLALKISVIVQLVILAIQIAQAIATAVVTFGASLLEIPIFKMITGAIIDILIDQALGALLG
jgi:hypothetical protein